MKKRKCNVLSKELIAKRPKLELDCCCQSCDKGTGLIITNIKASFKLDIPAEFEYIKKRCSELPKSLEIVCDQTCRKPGVPRNIFDLISFLKFLPFSVLVKFYP